MISINHINLGFGGHRLLEDVSFQINTGDRIGLVGNNGAGKTTLLKIVLGVQLPDSGTVEKPADLTIGYLPQQMKHTDERSLFNEARTAFKKILLLQKDIQKINNEIEERTDYGSDKYIKLINKASDINTNIEMLGAAKMDEQTERTLSGLGFKPEDFVRQTNEFSRGWRMRIELAKILLQQPDLLLLDEPTNHLDIESMQWMEEFLSDYSGAVIMISHDRAFLDNITKRTIEISLGRIYDYRVPYSKYITLRKERRSHQLAAYRNQQKLISDTDQFINRFRYKPTKAVQVQSRIKQLEKMDRIVIDDEDISAIRIRFPAAPRSGNLIFDATCISKKFGNKTVLENIDFYIKRGERIAFVGRNGEGKTTLSRILVGDLDFTGGLKAGHNVKIGYFAQNQDELLDEAITVFDTIDRVATGDSRISIRPLLGAFLFGNDDIDKKVKVLSGGERSRLALIKLLLEPFNLLVLDEPTNHLDMRSKDILKKALERFTGTLILVSHDREFLDGLIDNVYEFREHKIKKYTGSIYDFLEKKKIDSLRQLEIEERKAGPGPVAKPAPAGRESYQKKKEFNKKIRILIKKITGCENSIEELENGLDELTKIIGSPDPSDKDSGDRTLFIEYGDLKKALDEKMNEWEKLHSEFEDLKNNPHYRE
ncbi:MAG: ABC-F family ATP-binding cassette domain-containing protein [Actinobacteria bacterium]|nr:ABC-F family ATP-binding cassette domain-containing protein [Actinomycetota bacterium]